VYALNKREGKDILLYARLWKLLRRLKPDIVHTRNLAAMDSVISAVMAGVPHRVHSEHGWDMHDLHGKYRKYVFIRRACRPFIDRYIAVSRHLEDWLRSDIRVPGEKLVHIYNGVDTQKFRMRENPNKQGVDADNEGADEFVIGTVGRMETVKDQLTLVRAFIHLMRTTPEPGRAVRLVLIGDGPLRGVAENLLREAGMMKHVWIPGSRSDVDEILRTFDLFVLPSLNEGISNTILEAMASGLPVIATDVGGNAELVVEGRTGTLVPPSDFEAMAEAMRKYLENPELIRQQGLEARQRAVQAFSLDAMVRSYTDIYSSLLGAGRNAA